MPNNWHPKLPTSAKARRLLKDVGCLVLLVDGQRQVHLFECDDNPDARFIIGTVAAELCREIALQHQANVQKWAEWERVMCKWRCWAEGEDWQ